MDEFPFQYDYDSHFDSIFLTNTMSGAVVPHLSLDSPSFSENSLVCVLSSSSFTDLCLCSVWRVERITASLRNSGRMRESILENTGAPIHVHVPVHSQGHLLVEGVGAGLDHVGSDYIPDPGLFDSGVLMGKCSTHSNLWNETHIMECILVGAH